MAAKSAAQSAWPRAPKWLRKWREKENASKDDWNEYSVRRKALLAIGFDSYSAYLKSDLWAEIRARRLAATSHCSCCPKLAAVVHHDRYYRKLLLGDQQSMMRDLYPLCHSCHRTVEFDGDRKRSSGEAVKQFRRMLFKHRNGCSKSQMIREKIAKTRADREFIKAARFERENEIKADLL